MKKYNGFLIHVPGIRILNLIYFSQKSNLQAVFPDFGGPITAILIGTTGLGVDCFINVIGSCMNSSRA